MGDMAVWTGASRAAARRMATGKPPSSKLDGDPSVLIRDLTLPVLPLRLTAGTVPATGRPLGVHAAHLLTKRVMRDVLSLM